MIFGRSLFLVLLAGAAQAPAYAQQAPAGGAEAAAGEEDEDDIVVTGARPRGSVIGDVEPEVQLDRREVRAIGAGNLGELLDALAPQTRSGRGRNDDRPVVLYRLTLTATAAAATPMGATPVP